MSPIRPSFFILGAPKCGTSSFARYLEAHPQIVFCSPREPNFFSTDLPGLMEAHDVDAYLGLFPQEDDAARVAAEKSTWYLYSDVAVRNILDFDPDAKLMVMLRDPVKMARSIHAQQLINLNESEQDFEIAWDRQEERTDQWLLQYRRVCSVGSQLERLLDTTGGRNLKVVRFQEVMQRTEAVYLDVLDFIGVEPTPLGEYPVYNSAKSWRSRRLQAFVKQLPTPLESALRGFKRVTGIQEIGLGKWVTGLNRRAGRRGEVSLDFERRLRADFLPEVELLERLLGWDLASWK